jgi:3-demethoxyubiquinol 3-hydroxylase
MKKPTNLARLLRVNQAGEYGAKRIYAGQLAVLKRRRASPETIAQIEHMAAQEDVHLETFNALVAKNQIRPTALQPLWHVAGFALGAVTALMGERAAMACTVAVEEVIDDHYAKQSAALADEPELKQTIDQFRSEENEHRLTALESGAEHAVAYPLLRRVIQAGSKTAIWLSERV